MADINALIAQGVRPIQIEDPLSRAAKMESLVGARQQQQMNALKMQEYERGVAEQNALRELFRGGLDLESAEGQRRLYETSPTAAQKLIKGRLEARKLEQEARAKEFDTIEKKTNYFRSLLSNVTTPEQGRAWTVAVYTDPDLAPVFSRFGATPQQAAQAVPDDPAAFQSWRNQAAVGAARFLDLNKPQFFQQELGGTKRTIAVPGLGGEATVVPGSEAAVTLTEAQKLVDKRAQQQMALDVQRIKNEGERIGLEGRRLAVAEENARRDADPVFQQRMAAARTIGQEAAKGDVAAARALPSAISRAEEGVRLIDELIGKRDAKGNLVKGSKPHPGFEATVGATWLPGQRFVPGTNAAGFMARFDQIKGSSFLEAFESLKGGGAITEKEGQKGTDAINRMSIATNEKEFVRAAMDLQDVIRKGVANAQRRAAPLSGVAPAAGTAPAAGAAPAAGGVRAEADEILRRGQ